MAADVPGRSDGRSRGRFGGPSRRRDRLAAAALLGGFRQRSWSALILAAFAVLAAAGAAAPMFAEASANAAFQARRDAVPVTARQDDSPVVRLSADAGASSDQRGVLNDLRAVPGLTEPRLSGASVGAELAGRGFFESTISPGNRPTARERGRLFAVESPAAELVPVGASAAEPGLWLPEPLAARLSVRAGDPIVLTLGAGIDGVRRSAETTVAGIYTVDAGGRLPADPEDARSWALRRFDMPRDTEFRTLPAYPLIGDIPTVENLAAAVEDRILWSAEAALLPGATLAEARRTARGVEDLRRLYASTAPPDGANPLALRFASGIGRIADTAQATSDAVGRRTRPVEQAAVAVGLASVLAVGVLSARRRDLELRHTVAVGRSPLAVGGLWLLEHLLPAVLGTALGWLAAWQIVARLGPPGTLAESLLPAASAAALATLAGVATVAGVATLSAFRRVRPAPPATPRRALPWGLLVVVAALVSAAGLTGAGAGGTRGVDLLVPLLVLAAAGVIAGWVPARLAYRRGATRRVRGAPVSPPAHGPDQPSPQPTAPSSAPAPQPTAPPSAPAPQPTGPPSAPAPQPTGSPGPAVPWLPSSPGRAVLWLARRRLGAGGEQRLAVVVLTTGLGMLLFALSALQASATSADDRVAVAAGAEAVASLRGSWELDPDAAEVPPPPAVDAPPPSGEEPPVPGVRTPPLPPGNTLVWRTDFTTLLDSTQRDMLLVDPATFADVALWGSGTDLAKARAAVAELQSPTPPSSAGTPSAATPSASAPGSPTPGAATPSASAPGSPTPGSPTPGSPTPGSPTPSASAPDAAAPGAGEPDPMDRPIRAIAVADPEVTGLDTLQATVGFDSRTLRVVARVPSFPGQGGRPLWVVSAADVFGPTGRADPRLRPRSRLDQSPLFVQSFLWNSTGSAGVAAATAPTGTRPERIATAAELRQGDAYVATGRARGYQLAVATYLALLAVLTLCVYAQRTAATRRPADLMLARMGLGRSRILRSRALEFVLLATVALGAAVAGVAALSPIAGRLLDDQPGLSPRFEFPLPAYAVAVTAGAAVLATALAVALTWVRSPTAEEDAYRDD